MIPLIECKDRHLYQIRSRNLSLGVFNVKNKGFIGIRTKFADQYLFEEYHWDTGAPYGTVKPVELLEKIPDDLVLTEHLVFEQGAVRTQSWARNPQTDEIRPVIRIHYTNIEDPHDGRNGFEDRWADTGKRLPNGCWPFLKRNQKLFDYLKAAENRVRQE